MLQEMRKYTKSWISSIFLGGLALSFGIWGIADVFRTSPDSTVFSIGSVKVPVEAFSQELHNAMPKDGTVLTPEQTKTLSANVLDQMTLRAALDLEVDRLGLTASNAQIQRDIQGISAFNGMLGTFDHATFVAKLQQAGFTEDQFVNRTRQDLARAQMIRAVESGFELPTGYGRAVFAFINEQRAVQYVMLTASSLPPVAPPSDAALAVYVKAHPDRFSTPEYRSVTYATVKVDTLAPTLAVSDKDLQDEIESNRAEYFTPERRTLEQITFKSEAEAKSARAELDHGRNFAALAAERQLKDADYKLGDVTQDDLDAPRKVFFTLKQDETSQPVKSTFGWVLMHVAKITPGKTTSNDDIKKIVQKKLAADKISGISNAYTDAVGGGAAIDEAADKAHMTLVRVPEVDARGLAPDGHKVIDDPELLAAIFKAEVGEDSDPFSNQAGDLYAVKVNGVTPPKLKSLDQVRSEATAEWSAEQQRIALAAKAKALAARANQEHSLSGVAATLGAPTVTSPALGRGTKSELFAPNVLKAIFDAMPGETVAAPTTQGAFVLARVSGIAHPGPSNDFEYISGMMQFGREVSSDITVSLAKAIQVDEKLTVNQKMVDSALGSSGSGQ